MNMANILARRQVMMAVAIGLATQALANAQDATPAAGAPRVIHIHQHLYFPSIGDPTGDDPAARALPYVFDPENSSFDEMPSANRNWGDIGLFAYLGQVGDNTGLIVSRVTPDSPASKLGLVPRDVILKINDQELGDLSYRQIQIMFVRLTSTPKVAVTMDVWNAHTRRRDTLKAEFENDPPADE